ncbi:hypothetical protein [Microbacterium saperdae]|uniref:O-antigen ligase n=1 Tax=Microbacterium saperdae TaxID=69368 RepID=A0A543BQN2_9MICO|nr:hypothetical protein [Microbacterium saperdae]TQL87136.1 hypothetical protein FB560_2803 [Microbacterium saperdae]GGM42619.1 hypothetical protein GCM10010489_12130 [Microbacterium saperdae]
MQILYLAVGIAMAAIVFSARVQVAERFAIAFLILTVAVFPRSIVSIGTLDPLHVGLAQSTITVMSYHVGIALALAFYLLRRPRVIKAPASLTVFMIILVIFVVFVWGGTSQQWSGVWHLGMALACWPLGVGIASFVASSAQNQLFLARFVVVILLGELIVSVLQILGFSLPIQLTAGSGELLVGTERVIGTLGNPANLSKVSFLLMLALMPLASSDSRRLRRTVLVGIMIATLIATLTISRANVIATVLALAIWLVLSPGRMSFGQRFSIIIGAGIVVVATGDSTLARLLSDPEGSIRPQLIEGAMEQLNRTFLEGVGINSYVSVVGQFHATTATGFPVHNAFLLLLTELGPILTAIFLFPLVWLFGRALVRFFDKTKRDPATITLIAALPGLVAIMYTGYGILGSFLLPLLMLVCGLLGDLVKRHDAGDWTGLESPGAAQEKLHLRGRRSTTGRATAHPKESRS